MDDLRQDGTRRALWGGPPRRADRMLTAEAGWELLDRVGHGVLALATPDGTPYAVPMTFGRDGRTLFFHSAPGGRKLDILRRNPEAVLCVADVGEPETGQSACDTTLTYRSALAFGRLVEVGDPTEKLAGLKAICSAHGVPVPAEGDAAWADFRRSAGRTTVLRLDVEQISAKGRI